MEFSLVEIIISVRNKNEEKFHEYVDLDKVVHLAVDNFVDEKRKLNVEEMKKSLEFTRKFLGSNSLIFFKPQIESTVKEKIHNYFIDKNDSDDTIVNTFVNSFNRLTLNMHFNASFGYFTGVVFAKRGEKVSELGLGFTPQGTRKNVVARLKFIKQGDIWRLDEIPNITEIIDALEEAQKT